MTISKDDTIILDGGGDKSDIESRCDQIRDAMDNASSDYDRCVFLLTMGTIPAAFVARLHHVFCSVLVLQSRAGYSCSARPHSFHLVVLLDPVKSIEAKDCQVGQVAL